MTMAEEQDRTGPSFGKWMGSLWLYTLLRFGMFFALWGLLVLVGVTGYYAALIALVLSVPLSLVLLAKPRAAFTRQLEARVVARQAQRENLDTRLQQDD
jgi:hypothetical protein